MNYSEKELVSDLKEAETGDDMNKIRSKCIYAKMNWDDISIDTKKLFVKTQSRIHPCPQEYKDNPQIHYDVRMKKDTTSQ